jgi:hypothetical protein
MLFGFYLLGFVAAPRHTGLRRTLRREISMPARPDPVKIRVKCAHHPPQPGKADWNPMRADC